LFIICGFRSSYWYNAPFVIYNQGTYCVLYPYTVTSALKHPKINISHLACLKTCSCQRSYAAAAKMVTAFARRRRALSFI